MRKLLNIWLMLSHTKDYMKKQIIVIGIFFLFIFTFFCGCNNNINNNSDPSNESQKFIGTWEHGTLQNVRIIFSKNGNCNYQGQEAKWEIKEEKLEINLTNGGITLTFDYNFLDNNQILELINVDTDPPQVDNYRKQ
jgi:hypothetical protein